MRRYKNLVESFFARELQRDIGSWSLIRAALPASGDLWKIRGAQTPTLCLCHQDKKKRMATTSVDKNGILL
jgi:hypothetical protein